MLTCVAGGLGGKCFSQRKTGFEGGNWRYAAWNDDKSVFLGCAVLLVWKDVVESGGVVAKGRREEDKIRRRGSLVEGKQEGYGRCGWLWRRRRARELFSGMKG